MQQREFIPKSSIQKRVKARELAFQALFQYYIQKAGDKDMLELFIRQESADNEVFKLAKQWTFETIESQDTLDEMLASVMTRWRPSQLDTAEKAILRLSAYQMRKCRHIPAKVVINEAIELAKKFSTENSPGFVNGILDALHKKLDDTGAKDDNQPKV